MPHRGTDGSRNTRERGIWTQARGSGHALEVVTGHAFRRRTEAGSDRVAPGVDEPHLSDDIVFGARALDHLERHFARVLLDAWANGAPTLHTRCAWRFITANPF